jgi:hypothetical protein
LAALRLGQSGQQIGESGLAYPTRAHHREVHPLGNVQGEVPHDGLGVRGIRKRHAVDVEVVTRGEQRRWVSSGRGQLAADLGQPTEDHSEAHDDVPPAFTRIRIAGCSPLKR